MKKMKFISDESGVSLIELVLAVALLSIAFGATLKVLTFGSDKGAQAEVRTIQATLAKDLMNEIRSKRFDDYYTEDWSTTLGPEAGETGLGTYDDVDDFHGWSEVAGSITDFPHYARTVSVKYVDVAGGLTTPVTGPTDYKLVLVNVDHNNMTAIVDSLVITPGIPSQHYNHPLCLAGGIQLLNQISGVKRTFYGPFPKRNMTFTIGGESGTFTVDCETCIQVGDVSGNLKIEIITDTTGEITSACLP